MRLLGPALAVLLLAGCGGSADPGPVAPSPTAVVTTAPTTVGVPLPVRVTRTEIPVPSVAEVQGWLGPAPGDGGSPLDQVLRQLRYETLMQARVRAPTTARCAGFTLTPGATVRCTVAYQGKAVPWTVTIEKDQADNSGSVDIFGYSVSTDRYVLRGDVVRAEAWRVWGGYGEETRCGRLPAVQVVPAGRTRDRCQHLVDGVWTTSPVTVLDGGIVFLP